ncbi:hypothetical protein [Frankia sp. Cppng1_Ct_nod]|uniref:hypothetical protein n=1 Tax=Frankia sp. Cppng1_Ct_nod TaxID=2897162 RepID=UPI0020244609|nr:hypothetical protein [Frankia sp. Cppng1_Ct_nod]
MASKWGDKVGMVADMIANLLCYGRFGEAVSQVCATRDQRFLRINYEVLGNLWPHLHGHVHALYRWEEESLRIGPVYLYGPERTKKEQALSATHSQLHTDLRAALSALTRDAYGT